MEMEFIHYGSNNFNKNKFVEVVNCEYRNKPKHGTGMWASPVNSEYGWKQWCEEDQFRDSNEFCSFTFGFNDNANILIINSFADLINGLKFKDDEYIPTIDFETAKKEYDAILLTNKGQWETRHTFPVNLCGWDCECILVLKADNIVINNT